MKHHDIGIATSVARWLLFGNLIAGHHDLHHDIGTGADAMTSMMTAPMPDMGGVDTGGLDGALLSDGLHLTDPFGHDSGSSTIDPSNDPLHHFDPTGT